MRPVPACITPTLTREAPALCGGMACRPRAAWAAASSALRPSSGLPPAWAATPLNCNVEFSGGHKVVAAADDGTCRHTGPDMDRREIIHVIHHAGGHHRPGAAGALFSGLENQFDHPR
ncbi:Uncharacterised protein [Klebsiella aerogenes]|nr:Uncharacterised protein [Klebsiella aerogenes]